ncbi:MAG: hypothetical protein FJ027_05515 [Candidatus Rokubacteria bacterium]|nr:hypothetical protein [Candidatus Rokubacteria bacterium]
MTITRSGPPTTHDSTLWRVPLSAPPSSAWQQAFQSADDATAGASPRNVQFEHAALTFRGTDSQVPEWVGCIDRWIARANTIVDAAADTRRGDAARAQEQTDARRQRASESNEKFKNLYAPDGTALQAVGATRRPSGRGSSGGRPGEG